MVVCDLQMSRKYKLYLLYSSLSSFYDFLPSATVMKSPDVVSLSRERVSSAYSFGGPCPTLGNQVLWATAEMTKSRRMQQSNLLTSWPSVEKRKEDAGHTVP